MIWKSTITLLAIFSLAACNDSVSEKKQVKKNEVLVLGLIHSGHLKYEEFGIDVLTELIRKIDPDVILTEIPPDRFPTAMDEFLKNDTITEPRVKRFPEYVDVVFPLTKEMDFEIVPTAGWTKEMADKRSQQMKAIREDSTRKEDWARFVAAGNEVDSLMKLTSKEHDPYFINTDEYDRISEIELSVYNELFNEELGPGGWDNINEAHYGHIADALEQYKFQGKRILITYGAGHKGWFMRQLRKRDDIELKTLEELVSR